jgi:hypothetical protein
VAWNNAGTTPPSGARWDPPPGFPIDPVVDNSHRITGDQPWTDVCHALLSANEFVFVD